MFRASSAHLQENTVVHIQHMVLSLSMGVLSLIENCSAVLTQALYRQATKNSHRESQYHMLHLHNCILLKMSTWGSKHVEENNILWINNNQCIKLVINIYTFLRVCVYRTTFSFKYHYNFGHWISPPPPHPRKKTKRQRNNFRGTVNSYKKWNTPNHFDI